MKIDTKLKIKYDQLKYKSVPNTNQITKYLFSQNPTTMEESLHQVQGNQAQDGQPYTVMNAMILFGVDNINNFNGQTTAECFASELFSNSFQICMDKTIEELQNDLKQSSNLTQNQGQIRVSPGVI